MPCIATPGKRDTGNTDRDSSERSVGKRMCLTRVSSTERFETLGPTVSTGQGKLRNRSSATEPINRCFIPVGRECPGWQDRYSFHAPAGSVPVDGVPDLTIAVAESPANSFVFKSCCTLDRVSRSSLFCRAPAASGLTSVYGSGVHTLATNTWEPYLRAMVETSGSAARDASEKSVAYSIRLIAISGRIGMTTALVFILVTWLYVPLCRISHR